MNRFFKHLDKLLGDLIACVNWLFGNWFARWIDLIRHPWWVFNPPVDPAIGDLIERQFVYGLELVFGPLDDFANCVQSAAIRFGAALAFEGMVFPPFFSTHVIKLSDAAKTCGDAIVLAATETGQLPEYMSSLLAADRIANFGVFKVFRAFWNGRFISYVKASILRRLIRLLIVLFQVGVTVTAVYILLRMREQLLKKDLWKRKLKQDNPIVKDAILGYRRQR